MAYGSSSYLVPSTPVGQLTTMYNNSRGPSVLSQPSGAPVYAWHALTQTYTHTYIDLKKNNKNFLKRSLEFGAKNVVNSWPSLPCPPMDAFATWRAPQPESQPPFLCMVLLNLNILLKDTQKVYNYFQIFKTPVRLGGTCLLYSALRFERVLLWTHSIHGDWYMLPFSCLPSSQTARRLPGFSVLSNVFSQEKHSSPCLLGEPLCGICL